MKLKNLPIFIILFSLITFSSCEQKTKDEKVDTYLEKAEDAENNSIFNDAIEYNDAIVGIQTKVMVEVLNMGNYDNVSDMKEQLVLIQIELKSTLITLNKIYFDGDKDQKFKTSSLKLFNFYDRVFNEDYARVLDLLDIIENEEDYDISNSAFNEMNEIIQNFSEEETEIDLEFQEAQKSFARENNIFIDPSEHPLQEEIDNL
jgi:hypothetical protein